MEREYMAWRVVVGQVEELGLGLCGFGSWYLGKMVRRIALEQGACTSFSYRTFVSRICTSPCWSCFVPHVGTSSHPVVPCRIPSRLASCTSYTPHHGPRTPVLAC